MPERIPRNESYTETPEGEQHPDSYGERLRQNEQEAKPKENQEEQAEQLRNKIELEAVSGKEAPIETGSTDRNSQDVRITRSDKNASYKQTLQEVRPYLSRPMRGLSKIAHQPTIERISDISAKTVARPVGIIWGGLIALVGTSIVLWISSRHGYSYNFFLIIGLYIIGYSLGTLAELILKPFIKHRKTRSS